MVYWYHTPDDVQPQFGAYSNRIKWCEENCQGVWKYKLDGKFVFSDKKDYVLFLLRWS